MVNKEAILNDIILSPEFADIYTILEPSLNHDGYEIVKLSWEANGKVNALQILMDKTDGETISIDEVAIISHKISALLDVHSDITEKYNLEVSSSGIDRPLTRLKDFKKYTNQLCKLRLNSPIEGRFKFKGVINKVDNREIYFTDSENEEIKFSFDVIDSCKLKLTDELIRKSLNRNKTTK